MLKQYVIFIIATGFCICCSAATLWAQKISLALEQGAVKVVIDPGHGGHDTGVRGGGGALEKDLTLELARILVRQLEETFPVVLTRNADYAVDLMERGAIANHNSGSLFISLHIGGGFLHRASGGVVFYYQSVSKSNTGRDAGSPKNDAASDCGESWNCQQSNHIIRSRVLAEMIKMGLTERITFWDMQVRGAPLMVLKGVGMPAAVVEIGYLTNPKDEKTFGDPKILADIAGGISDGIRRFFNKVP